MSFPKFRMIKTDAEREMVLKAIAADNDKLVLPNYLAERNGEIVGAASLGMVPLVLVWNHTQKITAKDSMHMKLAYDIAMEARGHKKFWIACNQKSPYNAHMEKLGYKPFWPTELFLGGVDA